MQENRICCWPGKTTSQRWEGEEEPAAEGRRGQPGPAEPPGEGPGDPQPHAAVGGGSWELAARPGAQGGGLGGASAHAPPSAWGLRRTAWGALPLPQRGVPAASGAYM